jgi:hypothetical protein
VEVEVEVQTGPKAPRCGGAGGKGVVILSMPTAKFSGTTTGSPTVTTEMEQLKF